MVIGADQNCQTAFGTPGIAWLRNCTEVIQSIALEGDYWKRGLIGEMPRAGMHSGQLSEEVVPELCEL